MAIGKPILDQSSQGQKGSITQFLTFSDPKTRGLVRIHILVPDGPELGTLEQPAMQVYVCALSFGSLCAHRSVNPRGNASAYTPAKPETVATPDLAVRLSAGRHVTRQRSGLGLVGPHVPACRKPADKCEGPVKIGFVRRSRPAARRTQVLSSYCLTS